MKNKKSNFCYVFSEFSTAVSIKLNYMEKIKIKRKAQKSPEDNLINRMHRKANSTYHDNNAQSYQDNEE